MPKKPSCRGIIGRQKNAGIGPVLPAGANAIRQSWVNTVRLHRKQGVRWPVSRVLSLPRRPQGRFGARDGHSSGMPVARHLARPTRTATRKPVWSAPEGADRLPLFGLASGGVYHAVAIAGPAVRSCRTLSPLPAGRSGRSGAMSGGGLLSVALSLGSPPPAVSRHRVSVKPGLSSPRIGVSSTRERPSGHLTPPAPYPKPDPPHNRPSTPRQDFQTPPTPGRRLEILQTRLAQKTVPASRSQRIRRFRATPRPRPALG